MSKPVSVIHNTFVVERTYAVPPASVFAAWSDPAIKRRWFAEGEGWEVEKFELDGKEGAELRVIGWRQLFDRLEKQGLGL